jgi:hypothetical protein
MSDDRAELTRQEIDVLRELMAIAEKYPKATLEDSIPQQEGWTTSARIRESLGSGSLETRRSLRRLADWGYADQKKINGSEWYKINGRGAAAFLRNTDASAAIDSSLWTGSVSAIQVHQILSIVSEIEDACETITDNYARSQILGLVRALEILLTIPEPPRQGIIALIRDPAFNHVIGFGTFLAAIVAALKA